MIQKHAESMSKILGALQDLPPPKQHSQFCHNLLNWAGLAVLVRWQILMGSQDFDHTFSMALNHKWNVKNGFAFVLQFFSLISDDLNGVSTATYMTLCKFLVARVFALSRKMLMSTKILFIYQLIFYKTGFIKF